MSKFDSKTLTLLLNNLALLVVLAEDSYQKRCFVDIFHINKGKKFDEFISNTNNLSKIYHFIKLLELKLAKNDIKFSSPSQETLFLQTAIRIKKIIANYSKHQNLESEIENQIYFENNSQLFA